MSSVRESGPGGKGSGVGVLDKAVTILDALAAHGPLSLNDLVARTGLSRPTAHRLAGALEVHRLVGRTGEGRYRLGLGLVALASGATANGDRGLVEAARPALTGLRDETGESVQLFVRDGDRRVCVAAVDSNRGLRDIVAVGAALPLDRGSAGKVLLAWPADAAPSGDVSDRVLADVRRRGYAATVAEREPGVASVSAPVFDAHGRVRAAVSVSGPIGRLGRDPGPRFGPAVVATAREIERRGGLAGQP